MYGRFLLTNSISPYAEMKRSIGCRTNVNGNLDDDDDDDDAIVKTFLKQRGLQFFLIRFDWVMLSEQQ
jgi:hypothetical protein